MKKLLITVGLLILTCVTYAQIKGVDLNKAIVDVDKIHYGELMKINKSWVIPYNKTPIGIINTMNKFVQILVENDIDVTTNEPLIKQIILAPYVNGISDYYNLSMSLQLDESQVRWAYNINDYVVSMLLEKDVYGVVITKH